MNHVFFPAIFISNAWFHLADNCAGNGSSYLYVHLSWFMLISCVASRLLQCYYRAVPEPVLNICDDTLASSPRPNENPVNFFSSDSKLEFY